MNREEKYLARLMFKNRLLQAEGQAFQDLFVQVMSKEDKSFRTIRPHGEQGDEKNDGYAREKGVYYQCYGPETVKGSTAADKVISSFAGLKKYWEKISSIKEFHFVLNDKYKGTYPDIEAALASLEQSNPGIKCKPFLCKDIEDVALELEDEKLIDIIGLPPSPGNIEAIDYSIMTEVISHLIAVAPDETPEEKYPTNPDFEKKIVFNRLSDAVAALLRKASYQVGNLEDYFSQNSMFLESELQKSFVGLYVDAKGFFDGVDNADDMIFFSILQKASPKSSSQVRDAVLVLMSFYFEACDIFETPETA